jgi:phosphopantothenoylcysteine decarboxylase/phosphopantothenate--cysteine ligase
LADRKDLAGKVIVVTAGGTREPIDPVRYIGNRSSGKMGSALARAARDRGASVRLVTATAPTGDMSGIEIITVETALEMNAAVEKAVIGANVLIMAAAVADFMPGEPSAQKIKKGDGLDLKLVRTPDILSEVSGDFVKVGFAAESENLLKNAQAKLKAKKLDLIVANDITAKDSGFGADTNQVIIIDNQGNAEQLPLLSKREVAEQVLDRVAGILES